MIVMLRSRSFDLVNRALEDEDEKNKKLPRLKGSYGTDLYALEQDRAIITEPEETSRRRTIRLERNGMESWGFTLQTYGIRNKKTGDVEVMSYVDYIDMDGPAWMSGMRTGDIILSVNGESVESYTHMELVQKILQCRYEMRLVVLFENCCKKVELHERYLKLKKVLAHKLKELRFLEEEERLIKQGVRLTKSDNVLRNSTGSSISSDWDIYSAVASPNTLNSTPSNQFAFRQSGTNHSGTSQSGVELDSITTESSSSLSDSHWQHNASTEEIYSSGPDLRIERREDVSGSYGSDSRGFELSGQSDVSTMSEASDNGMRRLYNITRCAQRISDAGRCDGILAYDLEELRKKAEEGSMTNLAEDIGMELREVKPARSDGERLSSSVSTGSPPSCGKETLSFYIESDCEDSSLNSEPASHVFHNISSINDSSQLEKSNNKERSGKPGENGNVSDNSSPIENAALANDKKFGVDSRSSTSTSGNEDSSSSTSNSSHKDSPTFGTKCVGFDGKNYHTAIGRRTASMRSDCSTISGASHSSSVSTSDDSSSVTSDRSQSHSNSSDSSKRFGKTTRCGSGDERAIFQQPFYPESTSSGKRALTTSSPIVLHSKNSSEYVIQKPGSKLFGSSSSKRHNLRRSESAGVAPVLLSYKKDGGVIHTESKIKSSSSLRNEDKGTKKDSSQKLQKSVSCAEQSKNKKDRDHDNEKSCEVISSLSNSVHATTKINSESLLNSGNSLHRLSNSSDDSTTKSDRKGAKLVKQNNYNNNNDNKNNDNDGKIGHNSAPLSKSTRGRSNTPPFHATTDTDPITQTAASGSKQTLAVASDSRASSSSDRENNSSNDDDPSSRLVRSTTTAATLPKQANGSDSNDSKTNATTTSEPGSLNPTTYQTGQGDGPVATTTTTASTKNIPSIPNPSQGQVSCVNTHNPDLRSGRFMYGILVNNEDHSTRL